MIKKKFVHIKLESCLFYGRGEYVVKKSIEFLCAIQAYKCLFDSSINYIVCSLLWNLKCVAVPYMQHLCAESSDVNKMIAGMGFLYYFSFFFAFFQPRIHSSIHSVSRLSQVIVARYALQDFQCSVPDYMHFLCLIAVKWSRWCQWLNHWEGKKTMSLFLKAHCSLDGKKRNIQFIHCTIKQ